MQQNLFPRSTPSKWIQHLKLPLFPNFGALFIILTPKFLTDWTIYCSSFYSDLIHSSTNAKFLCLSSPIRFLSSPIPSSFSLPLLVQRNGESGMYPAQSHPSNEIQPPIHPQAASATHPPFQPQISLDSQRAGIPKRNPALPPNEQGLFPQGAVLPRYRFRDIAAVPNIGGIPPRQFLLFGELPFYAL